MKLAVRARILVLLTAVGPLTLSATLSARGAFGESGGGTGEPCLYFTVNGPSGSEGGEHSTCRCACVSIQACAPCVWKCIPETSANDCQGNIEGAYCEEEILGSGAMGRPDTEKSTSRISRLSDGAGDDREE